MDSKKYAKYFLLTANVKNGNLWGISQHTARDNMKKFIGRPLVVTAQSWHDIPSEYGESYEHPYLPTNDMNQIFAHQDRFKVGNIIDVNEDKNGDWYATIEMLPKFAMKNLPPFCSPAIYQLDASEHEGNISKWEALHLAALNENPAYGARIALLKGTCIGTANSCKIQFKGAKLSIPKDNFESRRDSLPPAVSSTQAEENARFQFMENGIKIKPKKSELNDNLKKRLAGLENSQGRIKASEDLQEHIKNNPKTSREEAFNHLFHKKHSISHITYALNNHFGEQRREATDEDFENKKENDERRFKHDVDVHVLRSKLEKIASRFDKRGVEPTSRFNKNTPLINKVPFGKEDRDLVDRQNDIDKLLDIENKRRKSNNKIQVPKPTQSDFSRIISAKSEVICPKKLKKRLASLGEENMTYQKSKHMKLKKNQKIANEDIENKLRSMGRSVDASHHQSMFLSQKGDFIGGGDTHDMQIRNILNPTGGYGETVTNNFLRKNGLIRVQNFPINRAGEKKIDVGINSKINNNQLKSIQNLEKEGKVIGFAVNDITGNGFNDMVKALRVNKFI